MFQLPNRLVLLIVLILVQLTNVSCTDTFQLPNRLSLFTVFILVPLTRVSCFHVHRLVISHCILDISHSIACTSSYTAFLLGACVVSQSQLLQYAVSSITALALHEAVESTYALITLFCTALVELLDIAVSTVGLLFKSPKLPVNATVLTLLAHSLLFHVAFSVGLTNKLSPLS
jgi:hypothetical protein